MDFYLIEDSNVRAFAHAILDKYVPKNYWKTMAAYEEEMSNLSHKIVERFNSDLGNGNNLP